MLQIALSCAACLTSSRQSASAVSGLCTWCVPCVHVSVSVHMCVCVSMSGVCVQNQCKIWVFVYLNSRCFFVFFVCVCESRFSVCVRMCVCACVCVYVCGVCVQNQCKMWVFVYLNSRYVLCVCQQNKCKV